MDMSDGSLLKRIPWILGTGVWRKRVEVGSGYSCANARATRTRAHRRSTIVVRTGARRKLLRSDLHKPETSSGNQESSNTCTCSCVSLFRSQVSSESVSMV